MTRRPEDLSLNIFDQIDSICREFRAEWKHGERPRIEDWVKKVPDPARPQLFYNLLEAELNHRRRKKERASSAEYLQRFPQFAQQVRQAFDESTIGSIEVRANGENEPVESDQTQSFQAPAANRLGDYELLRELGRGGMGVVYEARHTKSGNRVALKTLPTGHDGQELNADRLHRFRKEFRSLAEINHPNLVGMQSLEVDGAQWFFTMDLIEGEDFLSYVRPRNVVDEERLRAALKQLARGIMALHQRGIIHRDLKPSNVLVESDGRVAILDFGLVAEMQKVTDVTQTRSGMFAGTPRYAAPEQMFGQRSEASDWYALGVMLYECLTGEPPFTAKSPLELLRQKQEQDPPSLSGRDELPHDLTELVDGLLKRVPSERLGSAAIGARLQLESETRAYGSTGTAGSTGSSGSVADEDDPNFLEPQEEENVLIGREEQLAQLEEAKQDVLKSREPIVVLISGLSGEGKSALADHFLHPLRMGSEMLVLSGRCYDRESVPFKAIDCLIDSLVSFLRGRKVDQLAVLLPDDIAMLAHIFPLLRRVSGISDRCGISAPTVDSKQIRYRAFAALRDLLQNIGRSTPVVLFVDDLQWGDADSVEAMVGLLEPPDAPAVMFLGSYRRDEADNSPFLKAWQKSNKDRSNQIPQRIVEVHPLTPEQCLTLVALRAGIDPGTLKERAEELFADTQGNPYFLEQLVEGFDAATGSFRAVPLNEVITTKLKRLPTDAATLLAVIAVAGKAVTLSEASQVAGHDRAAFETITHMRSERLVRLVGSGDQQLVDTYHDKIRETVQAELDDAIRTKLHRAFGELIEGQFTSKVSTRSSTQSANNPYTDQLVDIHPRVPDLAFHFVRAGDQTKGHKYSLDAGKQAAAAYAFSDALGMLQQARLLESRDVSDGDKFTLRYLLGKVYSGIGRVDESIEQLQLATTIATSATNRSAAFFSLAEARYRKSDYNAANADYRRAFAELGEKLPKTTVGKLLRTAWSVLSIHLIPGKILRLLNRRHRDALLQVTQMYPKYSQLVSHLDLFGFIEATPRACVISKTIEDPVEMRLSYSYYAIILALSGIVGLRGRMFHCSQRFTKNVTALSSLGALYYHEGAFLYTCGNLSSAEANLLEADRMLGKVDDRRLGMALHYLRHLWSVRGNSSRIVQYAKKEYELAEQTNDEITMAYGNYGLADGYSRQGEFARAIEVAQSAVGVLEKWDGTFKCIAYQELGRAQLQASNYSAACKALTHAVGLVLRLHIFEISVPSFPLLAEAILGSGWAVSPGSLSRKERNQANRMARIARMTGWLFPNNRPHAYRISGRAATAQGKKRKALKYFDKAIAAATKIGAEYEMARSMIDKSMLEHPTAAADRQRGLALLEELGCVLPDAEVEYLGLDRAAHHARAAEARVRHEAELEAGK